eukprot:1159190-Pelagomonas_calceolata.AAC.9
MSHAPKRAAKSGTTHPLDLNSTKPNSELTSGESNFLLPNVELCSVHSWGPGCVHRRTYHYQVLKQGCMKGCIKGCIKGCSKGQQRGA